MAKRKKAERRAHDFYETPEPLPEAVCRHLRALYGDFTMIVEPSAGRGAFVRAARKVWPGSVIVANELQAANVAVLNRDAASDDDVGADDVLCGDWLELAADPDFATYLQGQRVLFLGNPPFSQAEAHIKAAIALMRRGDHLAFLLRGTFRGGRERYDTLFCDHGPERIIDLVERPSFTGGTSDNSPYAVFVWDEESHDEYKGSFLSWRPKGRVKGSRDGGRPRAKRPKAA